MNTMRGMIVGRFQPFHKGHLNAVKYILSEVDDLIVIIAASQQSHQKDNPFTAGERITMINEALKKVGIDQSYFWIIPIPDVHFHKLWVAQVTGYSPKFKVVYSNEPLTRRLFKEEGFKVKAIAGIYSIGEYTYENKKGEVKPLRAYYRKKLEKEIFVSTDDLPTMENRCCEISIDDEQNSEGKKELRLVLNIRFPK